MGSINYDLFHVMPNRYISHIPSFKSRFLDSTLTVWVMATKCTYVRKSIPADCRLTYSITLLISPSFSLSFLAAHHEECHSHQPVPAQVLRALRGRLRQLLDGGRRGVHQAETSVPGQTKEVWTGSKRCHARAWERSSWWETQRVRITQGFCIQSLPDKTVSKVCADFLQS